MALIKLTAIVDAISGKLNGTVFSRNKGGAYVRSRGVAINPSTAAQSLVRALFASISQAWRDLTDEQRQAWRTAAPGYPYQNSLGDTKTLTGKSLFQKLNGNLLNIGESIINTPLPPGDVTGVSGPATAANALAISLAAQTFQFEYSLPQQLTEDNVYVIEATPPVSSGVTSPPKSQFRKLDITATLTTGGDALQANDFGTGGAGADEIFVEYSGKFGTPPLGAKVFIRVKAINPATGQASPYFAESTFVAA